MSDPEVMTGPNVWVTFACAQYSHIVGAGGGDASVSFDLVRVPKVFFSNNREERVVVTAHNPKCKLSEFWLAPGASLVWDCSRIGYVALDRIDITVMANCGLGEGTYTRWPLSEDKSAATIANAYNNTPTFAGYPKLPSAICPCGIDRRDCEYHR